MQLGKQIRSAYPIVVIAYFFLWPRPCLRFLEEFSGIPTRRDNLGMELLPLMLGTEVLIFAFGLTEGTANFGFWYALLGVALLHCLLGLAFVIITCRDAFVRMLSWHGMQHVFQF